MKEAIIVYQDCFMCGASKKWGDATIAHLTEAGIPYRKLSFASQEGQSHALKAIEAGIASYPFVTDGVHYAKDVKSLIQAQSEPHRAKITAQLDEKPTKKTKKTTKRGKTKKCQE